jgi:hypothetical protein
MGSGAKPMGSQAQPMGSRAQPMGSRAQPMGAQPFAFTKPGTVNGSPEPSHSLSQVRTIGTRPFTLTELGTANGHLSGYSQWEPKTSHSLNLTFVFTEPGAVNGSLTHPGIAFGKSI